MTTYRIISQETSSPILLEEIRHQCEVTPSDVDSDGVQSHPDDALLVRLCNAAISHAENFTGLGIRQRVIEMTLQIFPPTYRRRDGGIDLPLPPVIEVHSVTNGDDSDGPLDPASFWVDGLGQYRTVSRLLPRSGGWPGANVDEGGVRIRYASGMSSGEAINSDAPLLDDGIKHAILMLTAHWYEHREAATEGTLSAVPLGVNSLLREWRVRKGMA